VHYLQIDRRWNENKMKWDETKWSNETQTIHLSIPAAANNRRAQVSIYIYISWSKALLKFFFGDLSDISKIGSQFNIFVSIPHCNMPILLNIGRFFPCGDLWENLFHQTFVLKESNDRSNTISVESTGRVASLSLIPRTQLPHAASSKGCARRLMTIICSYSNLRNDNLGRS